MPRFSPKCLEELRRKIDLIEVMSPYVQFQKAGAYYKTLCPFHFEHTPSMMIQRGDTHYHCFGCGSHGDAISFYMNHLRLSFYESIEMLADRFQVSLEMVDEEKGLKVVPLKQALNELVRFYHFYLLHSEEGKSALLYLYKRGIDLDFIYRFSIGLSPKEESLFFEWQKAFRIDQEALLLSGALKEKNGRFFPFFTGRVMFPIFDISHNAIGFSARKIDETTSSPKYINTPETPLFKKSNVLFGFHESRKEILKEKKVLITEGQIDCLRLLQEGFSIAVAGQGTAFGEGHIKQLMLAGVKEVLLAFDGDLAGQEATKKVGQLFQKEGIEVLVIPMQGKEDPDSILLKEGKEGFYQRKEKAIPFLKFLIDHLSSLENLSSPAAKSTLVEKVVKMIEEWSHPVMRHEGAKRVSELLQIPLDLIKLEGESTFIKKVDTLDSFKVDASSVLEEDLIRWVLLADEKHKQYIFTNLQEEDLLAPDIRLLFRALKEQGKDLLGLITTIHEIDVEKKIGEILEKKINIERMASQVILTVYKILERNWSLKREKILKRMRTENKSDEEKLLLAKEFDILTKQKPKLQQSSSVLSEGS